MTEKITLLLVGGIIGLVSSLITILVNAYICMSSNDLDTPLSDDFAPSFSWCPQPQQYQGQRPSRGRGIFRNALWLFHHYECHGLFKLVQNETTNNLSFGIGIYER